MTRVYICNRSTRRPRPLVVASLLPHRPMNRKEKLRRCLSSPSMNWAASQVADQHNCHSVCHLTPSHLGDQDNCESVCHQTPGHLDDNFRSVCHLTPGQLGDHDNCQSVCHQTSGHQPRISAKMRRAQSHNDSLHNPSSPTNGTDNLHINHHLPFYTCLEQRDKSFGATEKLQRERKNCELVHLRRESSSRDGLGYYSRNGMGHPSGEHMDMDVPSPQETCAVGTPERSNSAQLGFSWQNSEDVDLWEMSPEHSDHDLSLSTIREACLLLLDPHRRLSPSAGTQPILANSRRAQDEELAYFQNSQFASTDCSYDDLSGVSSDSQDDDDDTFARLRNSEDIVGTKTEDSDNRDEMLQFMRSVLCRKLSAPDTPGSPDPVQETSWSCQAQSPDVLPTKWSSYKNLLDIGWGGLQCTLCLTNMEIPPFASNDNELHEDGSEVNLYYPSRPNGREGLVTLYCPCCDRLRQIYGRH